MPGQLAAEKEAAAARERDYQEALAAGPPAAPFHSHVPRPAKHPSLWFVVPAYKRLELARVCLSQHAWACEQLALAGVDANVVVIADDENLDTARELGMCTIEAPNQLGAKYNDGYQLAASQGVDYVCALGSDSWIDPARLVPLPEAKQMLCTRNYTSIAKDGSRRSEFTIGFDGGFGSRVFATRLLAHCAYRPIKETLARGCDTQTLNSILAQHPDLELVYRETHPLELVGFESELQINSYQSLRRFWPHRERLDAFRGLADVYPASLVDRVQELYAVPAVA